ncbi:4'-phosphopantetheinyl transferase superfamily protein [Streptomyces sp. NPDC047108]|uniref:4'-phosphopantetheinyl transferase family protein n=1 Tax=Streptomyces sp. NPDC047108 TaxID=3155025 RepID=UPI0033F8ACE4
MTPMVRPGPAAGPQPERPTGAHEGQRPAGAQAGERPAGARAGERPAGAHEGQRPAFAPYRYGTDPLPGPRTAGAAHVWLVDVSAHAGAAAGESRLLDAGERERAGAFVRPADRDRYQVAHVALRRLLGGYLGRGPAEVEFLREPCPGCGKPHGRPALPGEPMHFSLSHSGDLVGIAVADTPVGIDVEELPGLHTVAEVASVLHADERAEIEARPEAQRPAVFARCWTRKEAYLKGTGIGLAEDLSVTLVGAGPEPVDPPGWVLGDVLLPRDLGTYAAACAVRRAAG